MKKIEEFKILDVNQKKEYLLHIMEDVSDKSFEDEETCDLLRSGFVFQDNTLNTIYNDIIQVIDQGNTSNQAKVSEAVHIAHDKLIKEFTESSLQADDLLKNL